MNTWYASAVAMEDIQDLTTVVVRTEPNGKRIAYIPTSLNDYFSEKIGVVETVHDTNWNGERVVVKKGEYLRIALINCSRI
jgi:hypothetical protein